MTIENKNPENKETQQTEAKDYAKLEQDLLKDLMADEGYKAYRTSLSEQKNKEILSPLEAKNKQLSDELNSFKSKLNADSRLKLIAEGKHEDVFRQIEQESIQKRDAEYQPRLQELESKIKAYEEKEISTTLLKSAEKNLPSNLNKNSVEDYVEYFQKHFALNEKKELVNRNNTLNTDGKPLKPENFEEFLRAKKPNWFDGPAGSGVGSTEKSAAVVKYTNEEIEKMTRVQYEEAKKRNFVKPN